MATECPNCNSYFRGNRCSCGYTPKSQSEDKPRSSNCAYPNCSLPGSICGSTHPNENSRWYCRYHFGYKYGDTPTPEEQMAYDAKKPRFNDTDRGNITGNIPKGPKKWAYDILALEKAGMYFDMQGIEMAHKALAMEVPE